MRKRPVVYGLLGVLSGWAVCPLKVGVVLGSSMTPTLKNHQVILIRKGYYESRMPRVGDVVVLTRGGDTLVKRVWAVEGDSLWEVRDPAVGSFLVATREDVMRLRRAVRHSPAVGTLHQLRIPKGCVYVVGDAAQCSMDSRTFGPVPVSTLTGRVLGAPPQPRGWR